MHSTNMGSLEAVLLEWIGFAAIAIEVLAVIVIVLAIVNATSRFLLRKDTSGVASQGFSQGFTEYKHRLGRALLIGLEILVAADVVRTVALEPTLTNVSVLGILVVIRTFLSWSLFVEIEGHWPWNSPHEQLQKLNEEDQ